jgi:hypothetical protein
MARGARLNLISFEDRITPATGAFAAGTLTITAQQGDIVEVSPQMVGADYPAGLLQVFVGGVPLFKSGPSQVVKNLIVKPGSATSYGLIVHNHVTVGNLTVNGAPMDTYFGLYPDTVVTGNVSFLGGAAGLGTDIVEFFDGAVVGGNALIDLKGGLGDVKLMGTTYGGNLTVLAGAGTDNVTLAKYGTISVAGNMTLALGDGPNTVAMGGTHTISVGKSFTYTGGSGADDVNLRDQGKLLSVSGNIKVALGSVANGVMDHWNTSPLTAGGNVTITGGAGSQLVEGAGLSSIGGNLTIMLGDGGNTWYAGQVVDSKVSVGGSVHYTGGDGTDYLVVDNLIAGHDAAFTLGGGVENDLLMGVTKDKPVIVGGNLTITGGAGADIVTVCQGNIAKGLSVKSGDGADTVSIDDTVVGGNTLIDLGKGADKLRVDTQMATGSGVDLPGYVHLVGRFTVFGGEGDDLVDLSDLGGQHVEVDGAVKLVGGAGQDTFQQFKSGNVFHKSTFEDFESGETFV